MANRPGVLTPELFAAFSAQAHQSSRNMFEHVFDMYDTYVKDGDPRAKDLRATLLTTAQDRDIGQERLSNLYYELRYNMGLVE